MNVPLDLLLCPAVAMAAEVPQLLEAGRRECRTAQLPQPAWCDVRPGKQLLQAQKTFVHVPFVSVGRSPVNKQWIALLRSPTHLVCTQGQLLFGFLKWPR